MLVYHSGIFLDQSQARSGGQQDALAPGPIIKMTLVFLSDLGEVFRACLLPLFLIVNVNLTRLNAIPISFLVFPNPKHSFKLTLNGKKSFTLIIK